MPLLSSGVKWQNKESLEAMQAVDELRKEADKSNERSLAIVQKSLFEGEEGE